MEAARTRNAHTTAYFVTSGGQPKHRDQKIVPAKAPRRKENPSERGSALRLCVFAGEILSRYRYISRANHLNSKAHDSLKLARRDVLTPHAGGCVRDYELASASRARDAAWLLPSARPSSPDLSTTTGAARPDSTGTCTARVNARDRLH